MTESKCLAIQRFPFKSIGKGTYDCMQMHIYAGVCSHTCIHTHWHIHAGREAGLFVC
jgi:hypothetical protein